MDEQFRFLALTLIGEARGELCHGIIGVGCVIRNRLGTRTYEDVVTEKNQFSCWNVDDPNYHYLISLDLEHPADKYIKQCLWVAQGIFDGDILDIVSGARNYVTLSRYQIAKTRNALNDQWILKMKPVITLDHHIFLKE